jgi:PAS domain S-box-containing protein
MRKPSKKQDDQQKAPKELQAADERLNLIAHATNDVLWDWDLETNHVWRSESMSEMFGYLPDELSSAPEDWINCIHHDDQKRVREGIQAAIGNGEKHWREEYRFRSKSGSYMIILDRGYIIHDASGKAVRVVGVVTDITKHKETELQLVQERNLLRTIIDNLPDAIYAKDSAVRKTVANPADLKNMGCKTEAEALDKTDFEFYPKDIAAKLYEDDQAVLWKGLSVINREERVVRPNGEVRWLLTTKIPWRNAAGKVVGLVGIGHDITQQKETEIKLMEERNLLRTVIENLPDAIYAKDGGARKTMANPADLKNLGYKTEAEVLGKTDYDFFPKDIAAKLFEDDQLVLWKGKSLINREEKIIRTDGEVHWLLTTKVPWRDSSGKIIGLVGIGRDITSKKHLEAQFLRAQRMESIGQLASGIAHDLNNILAPILISTSLLRQKVQDKEGLELLDSLESSAKRGADIVKQVLWFGRGLEGQREPLNPKQLVEEVVRIISETFSKSIEVETDIAADIHPIAGDQTQLHQVLLNLSVNARDAMPTGGKLKLGARNFTVDAQFADSNADAKPGPHVLFEVTDTGHGIPAEIRDRIFEPFFTTKELGKGTGLGLSTTLSIVKSHGGFIVVESEIGKGSTFQVYLPVAQSQSHSSKIPEEKNDQLP